MPRCAATTVNMPAKHIPLSQYVQSGWLPITTSERLWLREVTVVHAFDCVALRAIVVVYQWDHISLGLNAGLNGCVGASWSL